MGDDRRLKDQEKKNHEEDSADENSDDERRQGIDRRWIKSGYSGKNRRDPDERREDKPQKDGDFDPSRL